MPRKFIPLSLAMALFPALASEAELHRAFIGRPVTVKIDMPGTQEGVNLHLDNDDPMNWREYSYRLKNYGTAIPKGRQATVTAIVVKKNNIEFHLDGGGFGTFSDDSSSYVSPTYISKSDYERRLEKDIAATTDATRKRDLERDLSRERSRRQREEQQARSAAELASTIKRQEIMEKRLRGGSRFNLRWKGPLAEADLSPAKLRSHLAQYVEFEGPAPASRYDAPPSTTVPSVPASVFQGAPAAPSASAAPSLRKGMRLTEVEQQFGPGRLKAETEGDNQLKTQDWEFQNAQYKLTLTAVEGVVVRYQLSSR